jgi:hypothetical protein
LDSLHEMDYKRYTRYSLFRLPAEGLSLHDYTAGIGTCWCDTSYR